MLKNLDRTSYSTRLEFVDTWLDFTEYETRVDDIQCKVEIPLYDIEETFKSVSDFIVWFEYESGDDLDIRQLYIV